MSPAPTGDVLDGGRPVSPPDALVPFVQAGLLHAADVHVAVRLAQIAGGGGAPSGALLLGAALAVRAPRLGHVCVDLAAATGLVAGDDAVSPAEPLDWPDPAAWAADLAASPLVAAGTDPALDAPLRLVGSLLYLDRYWREERQVADDLLRRAGCPAEAVDEDALRGSLAALFGPQDDEQRAAVECGVRRRLAVICGGPGTGKTTTIARLLAALDRQEATGLRPRLVALAAPTGKAAARLEEAVHEQAARLDASEATRGRLLALSGSTLHRLLGRRPDSASRFRHDRENRLPHTLVVVDEASMTSLSLMARLLEALRDDARLVLVGDPDQLASVEAGAVLGDIAGPARAGGAVGPGVVMLRRVHRFGGGIAELADAIRRGDAGAALGVLAAGHDDVRWIAADPATAGADALAPVRDAATAAGARLIDLAASGEAREALAALARFRLLCPHRHGPYGVDLWGARVERWLEPAGALPGAGYPGLPLIVTENDYALRLFNGDTGVVVRRDGVLTAAFERAGEVVEVSPGRLAAVAPVHAMTVHKGQGSQFGKVAVVVAPAGSAIATRELLYTAVTRAQERVIVVGERDAIVAAVERPVARASGLGGLLAGGG